MERGSARSVAGRGTLTLSFGRGRASSTRPCEECKWIERHAPYACLPYHPSLYSRVWSGTQSRIPRGTRASRYSAAARGTRQTLRFSDMCTGSCTIPAPFSPSFSLSLCSSSSCSWQNYKVTAAVKIIIITTTIVSSERQPPPQTHTWYRSHIFQPPIP